MKELVLAISRGMGVVWLAAAVLFVASAVALHAAPRWFWLVGALAIVASQLAILRSWGDARFGTIANVIALVAVLHAAFARGPFGLRAEYDALVDDGLASIAGCPAATITEADLAPLPAPVQRYLRFAGVVGTPRLHGFKARMTGRIRGAADAEWMPFVAEQHNFFDPPRRYFFMDATRGGLPVDGLHAFGDAGATMRVRVLSLVPVVTLSGEVLTRTETVTIFNDMCIFAPASLLDPSIRWKLLDDRTVEATYTNGPHTVTSVLVFGDDGALVDFWSDDRPALAPDGVTLLPQRWSTPVGEYRTQGPYRLASKGEARYAAPSGDYAYIEFDGIETSALDAGASR
jgi:hypothetical protein